ncbi:hypothetical protein TNCV_776801 [Trichonephila clavipes]|nr:hypothetical protein TNCV_776801 [Trichonephila clavipes]
MRKNQESYDLLDKENRKLMEEIQDLEGELTLIGTCPIENCQHHSKSNPLNLIQKVNDSSKLLEAEYQKANAKLCNSNPSPNLPKKKNRLDGFTAPTKVVKKQKVLQNYSFGAAAPVTTTNKYQTLSEKMHCRLRTTQRCQRRTSSADIRTRLALHRNEECSWSD